MKKFISAIVAAVVVCCSVLPAFATAQSIIINGEIAPIPAEMGEIIEKDDRTFVPLRFVMENLNCGVTYDEAHKMAVIADQHNSFIIKCDDNRIYRIPDGSSKANIIEMDTNAFIVEYDIGGRMYVPIRFLAEAIGYEVGWDEVNEIVTLNKKVEE